MGVAFASLRLFVALLLSQVPFRVLFFAEGHSASKTAIPPVKIEFSCVGLSFFVLLFLRCKNGTVHKWGLPSLRSGSSSLCSSVKSRSGYSFLQRATVPQKQPSPSENRIFLCGAVFFCFVVFALQKRHCSRMGLPSLRSGSSSLCSSVKSRSGYHFLAYCLREGFFFARIRRGRGVGSFIQTFI